MFLSDENENNDNDGSGSFFFFFGLDIVLHLSYMLLLMQRSEVRLSSSLGAGVPLKDTSEKRMLATVSYRA